MKICGDNIDWSIHPRYIRSNQQTQSVHYFHSYAIKDRVDISTLSDVPPQNLPSTSEVLSKVISSAHEESIIHDNFAVLLGRMLCSNLKIFKETFADILDWHIPHKYSKEKSKKSEVVSSYYITLKCCIRHSFYFNTGTPWSADEEREQAQ